jgi:excisionase family DNA binding protein
MTPVDVSRTPWPRSVFIEEAADILGVSRRTVYYRIREGRLQTIRTRGGSQRVLLDSLEELLRAMRGGPAEAGAEPATPQGADV